jgi:cytochrome c oxidase subunit 3
MSLDNAILTPEEQDELQVTALERHRLEEQFASLEQQHEVAALGMWVFLATEVLFFGTLFVGVAVYRSLYPVEFAKASEKLNWIIGGTNTLVLLVSSLFMVLAVHSAKLGRSRTSEVCLYVTAALGVGFLFLKGLEYYGDYRENLIPGWRFEDREWIKPGELPAGESPPREEDRKADLDRDQVPHVKLFLIFYWVMTPLHALHVTIGIIAVLVIAALTRRGYFSPAYYSPVDVTGLYWHFVDVVWIFLLPTLYLLGTHTLKDFHIL